MAFNDSFGFFGHYSFSAKPTHGRTIFESMSESLGDSYNQDFSSLQSARLYADAVCLASAQYQLDRAINNRDTSKATELLTQLEKDFRVTPGPRDSLKQRRDFLTALVKISRGNSQRVVEDALYTIIGEDFVSYTQLSTAPFPAADPSGIGIFSAKTEQVKQFFIVPSISTTNTPITVQFELFGGSSGGFSAPIPGENYVIDPDPRSTIEQVTVLSVVDNTITAIFTRSHEAGTVATRPYPLWSSHIRYNVVTVKLSAAQDTEKRRKINELMGRVLRGVSQWSIVSDQGSFILDSSTNSILGSTSLA